MAYESEMNDYEGKGLPDYSLNDRSIAITNGDASKDLSSPAAAEAQGKKLKYPKQVFFIVSNEACERFSYYGMRTILSFYLTDVLLFSQDNATIYYHVFVCLCYFFPILGGIIADSWLGKYRTVAYISVLYALGNIVLSLSAVTSFNISHKALAFLGMFMIALGTGGIKPCVSSFGGDQFVLPEQERQLSSFFSVFYFSINAGSLISTWLTPDLRTISCLGYDTCYPLAFGVPAILMIVSVVLFVAGRPMYKVKAPEGNVLVKVVQCMWNAMVNKIKSKEDVKEHWLDYADSSYSEKLRVDIRITLRSLLLFTPLPVFWALYEQQGSRWTFQANNMNGNFGSLVVKPDQMQLVNPLLIMILLPLCEGIIYPALIKVNILTKPLQKMSLGGLLGAVAFVISGILEQQIEAGPGYALAPTSGHANIHLLSSLPCNLSVTMSAPDMTEENFILNALQSWSKVNFDVDGSKQLNFKAQGLCAKGSFSVTAYSAQSRTFQIYEGGNGLSVNQCDDEDDYVKKVNPIVRVMYHFDDEKDHEVTFKGSSKTDVLTFNGTGCFSLTSEAHVKDPDSYQLLIDGNIIQTANMDIGGSYVFVVDKEAGYVDAIIPANTVNIFWLIPQYFVMTVAEVLLSVTGYEFAFTQAPISMKSVVSAIYLLTDAVGNVIVIFIAELHFLPTQADEFYLFAGLMAAAMIGFILLAIRYQYVTVLDDDDEDLPAIKDVNEKTEDATYF